MPTTNEVLIAAAEWWRQHCNREHRGLDVVNEWNRIVGILADAYVGVRSQPISELLLIAAEEDCRLDCIESQDNLKAACVAVRNELAERALPVDQGWLEQMGGRSLDGGQHTAFMLVATIDFDVFLAISDRRPAIVLAGYVLTYEPTRGHVLDLLACLGSKEPT